MLFIPVGAAWYTRYDGCLRIKQHDVSGLFTHGSFSVWLFHPFAINISTRGNADSIVVVLVLLSLLFIMRKQLIRAAIA